MKKALTLFMCLIVCFTFASCGNEKETFSFDDLGFMVKMQIDETISVSHTDKTMLISNSENNESIGVISVVKEEANDINEIYNAYFTGNGEKTKTELSDNLIFVEIKNKVDSVVHGERVDKMYCFIFYDESSSILLYGRFFENSERDYVISLAKSIEVVKK